jgi:hypothetical protein
VTLKVAPSARGQKRAEVEVEHGRIPPGQRNIESVAIFCSGSRPIELEAGVNLRSKYDKSVPRGEKQEYGMTRAGEGSVPESILRRAKQSYLAPDGDCFFDETATDYVSDPFPHCSVEKIGINDKSALRNTASRFAARTWRLEGQHGGYCSFFHATAAFTTYLYQ